MTTWGPPRRRSQRAVHRPRKGRATRFSRPRGFATSRAASTVPRSEPTLRTPKKTASGFGTNVVVIREQPGGEFTLDDVMDTFARQTEAQAADARISEIEDRELDGVPARTYAFLNRDEGNPRVRQRQVVAVKGDAVYTITWSVSADEFEAQEATLDAMLASWRWTGSAAADERGGV